MKNARLIEVVRERCVRTFQRRKRCLKQTRSTKELPIVDFWLIYFDGACCFMRSFRRFDCAIEWFG